MWKRRKVSVCRLERGAKQLALHYPVPVVVAEDALENQSSQDSVEQPGCDEEEALHGAGDGSDQRQQPVVQMKLVAAQRDDDGANTTWNTAFRSAAELAHGEPDGTAEIEQITQADSGRQQTYENQLLPCLETFQLLNSQNPMAEAIALCHCG